ncbi:MAG: magnesium transporter [Lentisphaeria bacterium]
MDNEQMQELLEKKILEFLGKNNYSGLQQFLDDVNPVDLARVLEELDKPQMVMVFRLLPKDLAADVFTYMDSAMHQHIVESISEEEIRALIDEMFIDDAVDLMEELPSNMVRAVLNSADPNTRKTINNFLKYPENSAGSLMTVEFVGLYETMTCKEALNCLRKCGVNKETIYNCYATDKSRHLTGVVSLRNILLSGDNCKINEIMHYPVISATTLEDQEDVAARFSDYDLIAMPVVDKESRIVGIITIDDIIDVINQENTEDFEKMAALKPSENEYLKTSVWKLSQNRIVWLMVMMISATLTGSIISHFEGLLQSAVVLAAFIPMLMDTGGNCGAQASTLMIRGMAVGEIDLKDWLTALWKEFRIGVIVGVMLSLVNLFRIILFTPASSKVDIVVTVTLFITIVFAKVIGCCLPMFARVCKMDPALMASPMITTIVDAFSLIVYFSIASCLM